MTDPAVSFLDVTFDPDGRRLAAGGHGAELQIWDVASGGKLLDLEGNAGPVTTAVWSPDGRLLATSCDDTSIRVWDPDTGALLATRMQPGAALSLVWSHDGARVLTSSGDDAVYEWDVHRDDEPAAAILARELPYRVVDGRLDPP